MLSKPGRNDPCWCGSGKKYKNCHLREDETAHAHEAVKTNLLKRLNDFALAERLRKDFETAFHFFYGKGSIPKDIRNEEELYRVMRALDFFVYDYRLPNEQRVVERFASEEAKRLSQEERALLKDWRHSFPAVYEVVQVRRGEGLRMRDLVSGEEFDVREVKATEQLSRWDLVFTRLMRMHDHFELGGPGGLAIPSRFRGALRSYVEGLWHRYAMDHPEETYEHFQHASSQLINQHILNEIEPILNQPPMIVTMEGDPIALCVASFDVLDYPLALAGLRAREEFQEVEPEGAETVTFSWHEVGESLALLRAHGPGFEHKPAREGNRSLGSLFLTREELRLEVTSRRRLAAGKELLEKRVGSAIQHRVDSIEPLNLALERRAEEEDSDEEEAIEKDMPEQVEALQAEMIAKYHREWLDEKIPALEGQTPREAVQSLGGRVRVIRLLKEFEEMETNKARAGGIAYDLGELKSELGLSDQDFMDETRLEDRLKDELEELEELAHADRLDDALNAWRAIRQKYPIATQDDLEFAAVWDLFAILDEAVIELVNRLAMYKRFDEGIALLEEYLTLEPDTTDARRADIAEMRIERGEVAQGMRELQELAERVPENHSVMMTLAHAQREMLNRPDDAIATLARARDHTQEDWEEHNLYDEILLTYLDARRLDEAERFWHDENDDSEEKERDHLGWTKIMIARGDMARARESVRKVQSTAARNYWKGMVESLAGNFKAARKLWADDLKDPLFEEWGFWAQWTELNLRLREFDRVIEKIDPARLDFKSAACFDLAIAHAAKGNLEQAGELARTARAEMERQERRMYFAMQMREVRELADELKLPDAARHALGI